jgi:carbon monoxide dehydrogenase subunit G
MHLEHGFTVPVPAAEAWRVLLDVPEIAPCLPGATVDAVDGDTISGRVRVKVGPVQITYRGTVRFVETDEAAGRAVLEARGKEMRGSGTANATITTTLTPDGATTSVAVVTDLAVTGRPAQFGRGVLNDVGRKMIGQFAACLADRLQVEAPSASSAETSPPAPAAAADEAPPPPSPPAAPPPPPQAPPVDLLQAAGAPLAKRAAPAAGAIGVLVVVLYLLRRRRSGR